MPSVTNDERLIYALQMALERSEDELRALKVAVGVCEYALITGRDVDREDALRAIQEIKAASEDASGV